MKADTLSPSAIDTYLQCPEKFRHRYDAGTQARPSTSYMVGSLFHDAIESYIDSKYEWTFEQSINYVLEHVNAYQPKVVKEALRIGNNFLAQQRLPPIDKVFGTEISFAPTGRKIRGNIAHSHVDFPSGLRLYGIIDMIYMDGDTVVVADWKTQKSWITPDDLAVKVQAMAYALVVHTITNRPVRVEFILVRYPEEGPVVWIPEDDDFGRIEEMLLAYQRRIQADVTPVQAKPSDMCRFCEYNYTCTPYQNWAAKDPPNAALWETMTLGEKAEELDKWEDIFSASKGAREHLKGLMQREMEWQHIDAIGHWKIKRIGKTEYQPAAQLIIDQYGGMENVPAEYRAQLENFKRRKLSKPFLQRDWRTRKR